MNNTQYTERTLASVNRILIDTSTLMTSGFQQFIYNNKHDLLLNNKTILITKAVYTEIAKLLGSEDTKKSKLALAAIELITMNPDVFKVETVPLSEYELDHTFADAQLLSNLTLHKSEYSQLLITNDRNLSCDAFDLNHQQSYKGKKIFVCYISWCGELQCCECARHSTDTHQEITPITIEDTSYPSNSEVPNENTFQNTDEPWSFDWKSSIITLCGAGALFTLYKSYNALAKYVKY